MREMTEDPRIETGMAAQVIPFPGDEPEMPRTDDEEEEILELEVISGDNIDLVNELPESELRRFAHDALEQYDRDVSSRSQWAEDHNRIAKDVKGERGTKSFPWMNAANIKYPLIATAAVQFNARSYPAIVKGLDVVKPSIKGSDPKGKKKARASRVAGFMNDQFILQMPEWDDDTDKMTMMLPIHGCMFRQIIWDETYSRPLTELIPATALVVSQDAKSLETVHQFTKEFTEFPHEIIKKQRTGVYADVDVQMTDRDENAAQEMLEAHVRLDLDEDGYDEPWILIIHKDTETVLSMKAGFWPDGVVRDEEGDVLYVRRHVEFVKYDFMPDPDGGFLGVGFGFLLRDHSDTINTMVNQLIDAGTDQITGGGFVGRQAGLHSGTMEFEPGEWKMVNVMGGDLAQNIVPRPTAQPSEVMFNLLGLMIDAGKELASVRDVLTGEQQNANVPASTTLAIIEQGLQVFSAIYKRVYRSLTKEFKMVYDLNSAFLPAEQYQSFHDDEEAVVENDFNTKGYDICPVADPTVVTSAQRLGRSEYLNMFKGNPEIDQRMLTKRQLEAAEIEDIDELMPDPTPEQIEERKETKHLTRVAAITEIETDIAELEKLKAEIIKTHGEAKDEVESANERKASATEKQASSKLKLVQAGVALQEAEHEDQAAKIVMGDGR